jgi:hypothetical protein
MTATKWCHMRYSILSVLIAISTATLASTPSQKLNENWYPPLKKGLWRIFNSASLNAGYTTTELRCVGGAGQEKRTSRKEYLEEVKGCTTIVLKTSAKQVELQRQCNRGEGRTGTVDVIYQGDFSSNFERTMKLSQSMPTRAEGATKLTNYRFLGVCPKGMTPGDTFTRNSEGNVVGEWNRYTGRIKPMNSDIRAELKKRSSP